MQTPSTVAASTSARPRPLFYVSSTHWDREWYQPFQHYRLRLVALWDRWLADVAAGRVEGPFHTDGQAILFEDYLELRPERRAELERLARAGKIAPGPWYVQPDEFLVSGESLIRNLAEGHRVSREHGAEPSKAGLIADQFGHTSQLPQILAGFGVGAVYFSRGLPLQAPTHFLWEGSDGTALPAYSFPPLGYVAFPYLVRAVAEGGRTELAPTSPAALDKFVAAEEARTELEPILLFDGADHYEIDAAVWPMIKAKAEAEGREARHGSLDDYQEHFLRERARITHRLRGELRYTGILADRMKQGQWMIPGVAASRPLLKRRNVECELLLSAWAEPFCALAGDALPETEGPLRAAWRWLLQNHAHDSICGCSVDQVHRDMLHRFDQSALLAEGLIERALAAVAGGEPGWPGNEAFAFAVFNPAPHEADRVVHARLLFPAGWPTFAEWVVPPDSLPSFRIHDESGAEIAYHRVAQREARAHFKPLRTNFPRVGTFTEVTVAIRARVPALGYARFRVTPGHGGHELLHVEHTRHAATPSLRTDALAMENDALRVTLQPDGTFTLHDKRSGLDYRDQCLFEDGGDFGDGWFFGKPQSDELCFSRGQRASISVVEDHPLRCAFRVKIDWELPSGREKQESRRGEAPRRVRLDYTVALAAGDAGVEIDLTVDNACEDHRLRVLFPTDAAAKSYLADCAFDAVERPVALDPQRHLWREPQVETVPFHSWVACQAEGRGLVVYSHGLREASVLDRASRPIALTLFRAVGRTFLTNGEPDGQAPGLSRFRFRVAPSGPEPRPAAWAKEAAAWLAGTRVVRLQSCPDTLPPRDAHARQGLAVEGEVVLSALRTAGDFVELRLFNPAPVASSARLRWGGLAGLPPESIQPVTLEGRPCGEPIPVRHGGAELAFAPGQIRSFHWKRPAN